MDNTIFTEYFGIRLLINIVSMIILIRLIYFGVYNRRELFTPFFLLNFIIFLLAYMLMVSGSFSSLGSMGPAVGLLAAFSLLRFRTDTLSMKDMTYLFIVMTIGLINSIMAGSYYEIAAINLFIIAVVFVVDGNMILKNEKTRTIEIETLENIKPEDQTKLLNDLRNRTGLDIKKITIEYIDFVRNRATIKVFYY